MTAPAMLFPVYGHCPRETVAVFFELGAAQSFAMRPTDFGYVQCNLYIDVPVYASKLRKRWAIKDLPSELRRENKHLWDGERSAAA